ncbi:hypothetical protein [Halobaculum sp. EA56]|uniref:hypothetical protein n=1 Tax=Halobaculum sp. EA56 TaxID=3421648 RepID=UPI003EB74060
MPDITLSDDQIEYLDSLREWIAEEHVGPYGHVRMRDTVQFLIDRHEREDTVSRDSLRRVVEACLSEYTYQELQSLAAETAGVEPGGKAEALRSRLVDARVNEVLDDEATNNIGPTATMCPTTKDDSEANVTERTDTDDSLETENGESVGGTEDAEGDGTSDDDSGDSIETGRDTNDGGTASGEESSRLQRMIGLLDRYDDVWEETDSDEGKYAVTLPEGGTRTVRTKDDVRALLFRHYD